MGNRWEMINADIGVTAPTSANFRYVKIQAPQVNEPLGRSEPSTVHHLVHHLDDT